MLQPGLHCAVHVRCDDDRSKSKSSSRSLPHERSGVVCDRFVGVGTRELPATSGLEDSVEETAINSLIRFY